MKNKNQGITLIALIITVILLLILAGVAISSLTGKDGMLAKISAAKEASEQAHIKEEIGLRIQEFYMEKAQEGKLAEANLQNLSTYLSNKLDNVVIKEVTNEKLVIEYKGYELKTDNKNNVEILGEVGLRIEYGFESEEYTKDTATMTFNISTPSGVTVTSITPLTEGTEVVEANSKFKFTANGIYEFKVVMSNNAEKIVKVSVDKIDTEAPNADIKLTESYNFINGTLKAKVTLTDDKSGVSLENSKWIINKSDAALGTDISKYTGGQFESEEQEISSAKLTASGSYYFHILATDKFGNSKEYISEVATIKEGYAISTPQDLQNIKNNLTASYYVVNDIDVKNFAFTQISGTFTGTLDGQGHTISNFKGTSNAKGDKSGLPLFDRGSGFTIKNVIFKDVNINYSPYRGDETSAIMYCSCGGTFEKVGVTGHIAGLYDTASFVANSSYPSVTKFINCYARTELVQQNAVNSSHSLAGFFGNSIRDNAIFIFENCYWAGTVNVRTSVGAMVLTFGTYDSHIKKGSRITNCFYNNQTCTTDTSEINDISDVKGLETAKFANASNFTSVGWDFENTWEIGTSGYPELKFEKK